MKKLVLLMLVVFAAVACEGPAGPEGPPGPPGDGSGLDIYEFNQVIEPNQWSWLTMPDGISKGYMCDFADKNIYQSDYEYGLAIGYVFIDGKKHLLPYSEVQINNFGEKYTENYTFSYEPGYVTFYINTTSSRPLAPPAMDFQVFFTTPQ